MGASSCKEKAIHELLPVSVICMKPSKEKDKEGKRAWDKDWLEETGGSYVLGIDQSKRGTGKRREWGEKGKWVGKLLISWERPLP